MAGAQCRKCGWEDPDYVPPVLVPRSAEEIAADLATPHTLTSAFGPAQCRNGTAKAIGPSPVILSEPGLDTQLESGVASFARR